MNYEILETKEDSKNVSEKSLLGRKPTVLEIIEKTNIYNGIYKMVLVLMFITIIKYVVLILGAFFSYKIFIEGINQNKIESSFFSKIFKISFRFIDLDDITKYVMILCIFTSLIICYFICDILYQSQEEDYINSYIENMLKIFVRYFSFCLEQDKINRCLPQLQEVIVEVQKFIVSLISSLSSMFTTILFLFIMICYFYDIFYALVFLFIIIISSYLSLFCGSSNVMLKTIIKTYQQARLLDIIKDSCEKIEYMILSGNFDFIPSYIFHEIDIFIKADQNLTQSLFQDNLMIYVTIFLSSICMMFFNFLLSKYVKFYTLGFWNAVSKLNQESSDEGNLLKARQMTVLFLPILNALFLCFYSSNIKLISSAYINADKIKYLIAVVINIKSVNYNLEIFDNKKSIINSEKRNTAVCLQTDGIFVGDNANNQNTDNQNQNKK